MRFMLLAPALLALVGCQARDHAAAQQPHSPGGAVQTAPPNKRDAQPAFKEQTRAPEHLSGVKLKITDYATDIGTPWAMALLPDGDLLVTSKRGKLFRVKPSGAKSEITGVPPVSSNGQGGLLDISLSPDFTASRTLFFTFSQPREGGANSTSVGRAQMSADGSRLENLKVIFQQNPAWKSDLHFGSNIEWDGQGNFYLTLGERSLPEPRQLAQDLKTDLGKVVRLTPHGAPAPGNPFLGRTDARPEIWSYGHRNVQGAAINPATGKLWTIEHGPRGGDEINVPQAGKNYGWPIICYCIDYSGQPIGAGITSKEGMEQPAYYFDPVIAPGDMIFYTGDAFPKWKGNILIAALSGSIVRLEVDGEKIVGEERLLRDEGRFRDILQAPDGALFVTTESGGGKVLKLTPG
jgi:glucose/arabinose dehydrogenase